MQDHAADQLHVVVALAHAAAAGLAGEGERLGQQVVEGLAVAGALAQLVGLLAQLMVLERSISGSIRLIASARFS